MDGDKTCIATTDRDNKQVKNSWVVFEKEINNIADTVSGMRQCVGSTMMGSSLHPNPLFK